MKPTPSQINAARTPDSVVDWLIHGEHGMSSSFMVAWLYGDRTRARLAHPHDPDDLRRCLLLCERSPELAQRVHEVASASPTWALLAERWATLALMMDQECPRWRADGGLAPGTYELMREIERKGTLAKLNEALE